VGVVASLTSALVFYVTRAQAALNTLRGFRSSIDAAIEERRKSPKFAVAQAKLAKAEADLAGVTRTVAEASQAVQDAQTEWHASTPRGRLNDFIRAKVLNGDYAKHLGIVAAIRRDFEHLAHIMAEEGDGQAEADYQRARDEHKRELQRLLEDGKGLFTPAELADLEQRISADEGVERDRFFERIILYIDDLDRCPEDKVVDVLQAIHLLLYFPLFVVVVAVDARWVSRALQTKYPNLLSENVSYDHVGAKSAWPKRARTNGASSQDYLEKIFQIPYWVRPMDGKASADYVTHLLNGSLKQASRKSPAENSAKVEGAARQRPRPTDVTKAADSVAHAGGRTAAVQATQEASAKQQADSSSHPAPTSSPERLSAPPVSTSPPLSRAQIEAQQRIEARSLSLTEHEEKLLKAMAPFAGDSPRRGLRFVNTYRLVRTSLSESERAELLGKTGEKFGFRALMTQLAIATGSPEFSQRYFEALAAKPASLEALLDAAKPGGNLSQAAAWKRLEGAVGVLNQGTGVRDPRAEAELIELLGTWGEVARRYSFSARPH